MAQYYQVLDQSDKTSPEELQNLYPNIVENQPTVRYVLNHEEAQQLQQSQPIIVTGGEQYMVLDNVIDPSAITFQNQPFDIQQGQQQIYYMESDDNTQNMEAVQPSQPVVLNHQLQGTQVTTVPQKVIMLQQPQHSQPTMVIQQPQLVSRQIQLPIQKTTPQRVQNPQIMTPQRLIVTQHQPRASLPNITKPNLIRGTPPRLAVQNSTGTLDGGVRPVGNVVRGAANRGVLQRNVARGGVIQGNGPRAVLMPGAARGGLLNSSRNVLARARAPLPNITVSNSQSEDSNSVDAIALEDGRVISMVEYQRMMQEKKKAESNVTSSTKQNPKSNSKPLNRRVGGRPPVNRMNQAMQHVQTPGQLGQPRSSCPGIVLQPPPQPQNTFANSNPMMGQVRHPQVARIIQPQNQDNKLPSVLRNFVPPPEIKDIINKTQHSVEFQNSIRMFVLLANGEQRLITFTMPKEDCTIQEILEQVGVPLQPDTKIAVSEAHSDGINLVVTVGISDDETIETVEGEDTVSQSGQEPPKVPTPELPAPPEPEQPKYVPGMLAVCSHCGFLSDDFNKCIRCKSKLPDGIKSVPTLNNPRKGDQLKKHTIALHLKNNGNVKGAPSPIKKKPPPKSKIIEQEPVILTLSSDDENEDDDKLAVPTIEQLMKKAESQMSESILKEPTVNDIQENDDSMSKSGTDTEFMTNASASIFCRTVRIGSYRFSPTENVIINGKELIMKVPSPKDQKDIKIIRLEHKAVVRVLTNFQKILPVIFYYVVPSVGEAIRKELDMQADSEIYFDPLSNEEAYKRITLLPETISEEIKSVFKTIYGPLPEKMKELNAKEANNILIRTCPKEITQSIPLSSISGVPEVKQLLIYPPGKGGLSINTEDYMCLAQDQFLNDVIIDFYIKYLVSNLPKEKQEKIHVFSTFFYKRLTTKPAKPTRKSHPSELDPNLTAVQKRHARVKNWTKNVNLFEKDFIVVPINENAHWFLAIICFPGMDGPHTFDGKPHKLEPTERKKKNVTTIGTVTITQIKVEKQQALSCDGGEGSDKDEAEGDESELDSGEESDEQPATVTPPAAKQRRTPIQQPCILIFDSLAGASRARVVATLRDYLTCEYKIKQGEVKIYNKDVIKGACPKVPQQTNYTDCGLYLLQYVESFLLNPIKDYHIPINELKTWFEEIVVTRKREELSHLIKEIMINYKKDITMLPQISFPTLNGELVEHPPEEEEEEEMMEDEEEEVAEEEDEEHADKEINEATGSDKTTDGECDNESEVQSSQDYQMSSPLKPSSDCSGLSDITEEAVSSSPVRPDLSEVPKASNRDTMSYLKSKRIIRHNKLNDGVDVKKFKPSTD